MELSETNANQRVNFHGLKTGGKGGKAMVEMVDARYVSGLKPRHCPT